MTAKVPWYDKKSLKPKYIETPISKYVGGQDKVMWPTILVVIVVGAFLGVIFL